MPSRPSSPRLARELVDRDLVDARHGRHRPRRPRRARRRAGTRGRRAPGSSHARDRAARGPPRRRGRCAPACSRALERIGLVLRHWLSPKCVTSARIMPCPVASSATRSTLEPDFSGRLGRRRADADEQSLGSGARPQPRAARRGAAREQDRVGSLEARASSSTRLELDRSVGVDDVDDRPASGSRRRARARRSPPAGRSTRAGERLRARPRSPRDKRSGTKAGSTPSARSAPPWPGRPPRCVRRLPQLVADGRDRVRAREDDPVVVAALDESERSRSSSAARSRSAGRRRVGSEPLERLGERTACSEDA